MVPNCGRRVSLATLHRAVSREIVGNVKPKIGSDRRYEPFIGIRYQRQKAETSEAANPKPECSQLRVVPV